MNSCFQSIAKLYHNNSIGIYWFYFCSYVTFRKSKIFLFLLFHFLFHCNVSFARKRKIKNFNFERISCFSTKSIWKVKIYLIITKLLNFRWRENKLSTWIIKFNERRQFLWIFFMWFKLYCMAFSIINLWYIVF